MAYNPHNLSVLAYANGFTLWNYITTDIGTYLVQPGYFDTAHDVFRIGDVIEASSPGEHTRLLVLSSDGGRVAVKKI